MKLVRLATDNDGVFASAFENNMTIPPQSQMALLNLTFQSNIGTFVVIPNQAEIKFTSEFGNADSIQTVIMPSRSYTVGEIETYYKDVQHALNSALKSENATGGTALQYNSVTSAFRIGETDGGFKTVEYRYAPFINPIVSFNTLLYQAMIWNNAFMLMTITGGVDDRVTVISKQAGQPATTDRTYKVLPLNGRRLNDGNSIFTARVNDLIDNGDATQNNGFGIGLSKTNLGINFDNTADIPASARDFEIRINKPPGATVQTYKYIDDDTDEKDSGVNPARVSIGSYPELNVHDVMCFIVSGNILTIGVAQDNGDGVFHTFSTVEIKAGEELYPYLYIRGAEAHCKVDMFNFSVDPWLPSIGGDERGNDDWRITGKSDTGMGNSYSDVLRNSVIGDVLPEIGVATRFEPLTTTSSLLMNKNIWRGLGFFTSKFKGDGNAGFIKLQINKPNPQPGWIVLVADGLPSIYSSDNFIVESMSLPLDSFDASQINYPIDNTAYNNPTTDKRGRRKNILMTIPENNNTNGLVEYESSTPIFIDINNAQEINAKNLNFRILNKDFSPIIQNTETALMTILIKKSTE